MEMEDKENKNNLYNNVFQSAIKASYFDGIRATTNPKKKATVHLKNEQELKDIEFDDKTFRVMRNFGRPVESVDIPIIRDQIYLEKQSFLSFCCVARVKSHRAQLYKSKFVIKNGQKIVRFVNFNAVTASVCEKNSRIQIQFEGSAQNESLYFYLKENSIQNRQNWLKQLNKAIKSSIGYEKTLTYLARTCPSFYKCQHILTSEFEAKANTGDILLFKSGHIAAHVQRLVNNSQYDHVGIVLRNKKNQLYIYESTSHDGVGMSPWRHMLKYEWYDGCQRITWRPINLKLSNVQVDVIENFITKTLGHEFQLNLAKLCLQKTTLIRTTEVDAKKTYFCSELAARLYKELKILDSQKSSSSYYPLDFSNKVCLQFTSSDVNFGNEKIISFEKNVEYRP